MKTYNVKVHDETTGEVTEYTVDHYGKEGAVREAAEKVYDDWAFECGPRAMDDLLFEVNGLFYRVHLEYDPAFYANRVCTQCKVLLIDTLFTGWHCPKCKEKPE